MPTFPFRSNKGDKKAGDSSPSASSPSPSSPKFTSPFSNLKSQGEKKLNEAAAKRKKLGMFSSKSKASSSSLSTPDNSGKGSDDKFSVISEDSLQVVEANNNIQEETSEIFVSDRSDNWQQGNSGSSLQGSFGSSLSSLSSKQSEADAFFIQHGVRQSQQAKLIPSITSSGRTAPRVGAVSLEAHMSLKYSKATGFATKWFKAYVILEMDGYRGTIKIFKDKPENTAAGGASPSAPTGKKMNRRKLAKQHQSTRIGATDLSFLDQQQSVKPLLEIPASMNWVAKDYENSSRRFVVEIPSESASMVRSSILYSKMKDNKINTTVESEIFSMASAKTSATSNNNGDDVDNRDATDKTGEGTGGGDDEDGEDKATPLKDASGNSLLGALQTARRKKEPFRLHFQCLRKGGNEKQVWMTAFEELGRLSFDLHKRVFGLGKKFKDPSKNERTRVKRDDKFAKQAKLLSTLGQSDLTEESPETGSGNRSLGGGSGHVSSTRSMGSLDVDDDSSSEFDQSAPLKANYRLTNKSDDREFMVYPTYAYPNKWMTHSEIYNEMLKPSLVYHDLRIKTETRQEIGTVRVEILECSGLPSLDWNSETDAVVYLVCGSYAFTSDVIQNKLNPVWLPRSRRACIFPLFNAYAKVFAGVFDDDGPGQKDDFAGRVVLDLAKCRPGSTYDVALPLRQSSQVYSRRPRGAIRLRFSIDWTSHKAAMLSYLPEKKQIKDPDKINSVSVLCYDETSFRNITLTVHGEDLPGRFSNDLMKSTTREINFLRKVSTNALQDTVLDIVFWKNRPVSAYLFCAWMHCCYLYSFGYVPFYALCLLLLIMMQNYAFYGSNGRVQQGFVPPSFEEMLMALIRGKPIEPLYVRPHRDEASALKSENTVKTHDEIARTLFDLLGFKSCTEGDYPEDYHMEFPLSRGIRHPIDYMDEYLYPKFSIEECKVKKKSQQSKNNEDDDDRAFSMDIVTAVTNIQKDPGQLRSRAGTAAATLQAKFGDTLDRGKGGLLKGKEMLNQTKEMLEMNTLGHPDVGRSLTASSGKLDLEDTMAAEFQRLPKNLQIQNQDIDVPEISESGEKKKIIEELTGVRNEFHDISKFAFLDKTHIIAQKDPIFFGGKQSKNCGGDLDKLLGLGTHSTANPVKSMIAAHMAPLVSAIHAFLHAIRCLVNIATWHDPILSFWVTLGIFAAAVVSLFFPFRIFFVLVGLGVLGPQNYFFVKYVRPHIREEISEFQKKKRLKKLKRAKENKKKVHRDIPTNQPIITSHTSDNSPPLELTLNHVDKRGVHQVCVPYSPLTYRRDNYWPPQPEYGRCDPDVSGFERSMQRMQQLSSRKSTIGLPSDAAVTKRKDKLPKVSES